MKTNILEAARHLRGSFERRLGRLGIWLGGGGRLGRVGLGSCWGFGGGL
jgi:hypothetical protein